MTYSLNVEYKEGGHALMPTAVININIGGRDYIMDLITYNENIEAGRTIFVQVDDEIRMISEEDAIMYRELEKSLNKWKNNE